MYKRTLRAEARSGEPAALAAPRVARLFARCMHARPHARAGARLTAPCAPLPAQGGRAERLMDVRRPMWVARASAAAQGWQLTGNNKSQGFYDAVVIAHNGKCANRCAGALALGRAIQGAEGAPAGVQALGMRGRGAPAAALRAAAASS